MEAKQYLEYLDKEMTIMGILSGVSVAVPAGILSTVLGEKGVTARDIEAGEELTADYETYPETESSGGLAAHGSASAAADGAERNL
jgi:hypothetical protein